MAEIVRLRPKARQFPHRTAFERASAGQVVDFIHRAVRRLLSMGARQDVKELRDWLNEELSE